MAQSATGHLDHCRRPGAHLIALLSALAILTPLGAVVHADCGVPAFGPTVSVGVGSAPKAVAVGDFNRDGALDLAVPNSGTDDVSILLGDGLGGFAAPATLTAHDFPNDIQASDLNLDGQLDLAVTNFTSGDVSIFLGNGAGGFGNATNFTTGVQPTAVEVGDFNRDGKPDLAVVRLSGTTVAILTGDGTGSFSAPTTASLSGAFGSRAIHTADLDRNGTLDLVVTVANASAQGSISILKGNGAGAFVFSSTTVASSQLIEDMIVADLDRDGIPDVVTGNTNTGGLSVLLGNGSGGLGAPTSFLGGERVLSVAVGDVNLDGKPDLVAGLANSSNVAVLLGDGAGGLAAPVTFNIGASAAGPFGIAVGDFDLDGKPDFATSNSTFDEVAIRRNTCGEPVPTPTPTATPVIHGFVPTDKTALGCADTVAKAVTKAVGGLVSCRRKAAAKAFKVKPFDQGACELGVLATYDRVTAALFARKACPACLPTSVSDLRQQATRLDQLRDPPYCAGTVAIP